MSRTSVFKSLLNKCTYKIVLYYCCCSSVIKYMVFWGWSSLNPSTWHVSTTFLSWYLWKSCAYCRTSFPVLNSSCYFSCFSPMDKHCCCSPLSPGAWYEILYQFCDVFGTCHKPKYHWVTASCALSQRKCVAWEILQLPVVSQFTILLYMNILYSVAEWKMLCAELA